MERTDGLRLQVDYGKDETALVELWRVHVKCDLKEARDGQLPRAFPWHH